MPRNGGEGHSSVFYGYSLDLTECTDKNKEHATSIITVIFIVATTLVAFCRLPAASLPPVTS
jgi:hypothetical protein